MKLFKRVTVLFYYLLLFALFACNTIQPAISPTQTLVSDTPTVPQLTDTPEPTPTMLSPLAILLAPAQNEQGLVDAIASSLKDLTGQTGLRFETRQAMVSTDLEDEPIALVVVLPGFQGLSDLAKQAPKTQFLAIGYPELQATGNLSLIMPGANQPGSIAFIAGYIAAVVTPDWRAGVITLAGTPAGVKDRQAFSNGLYYFCGLCRSVYPPYPIPGYPLYYELNPDATQSDWDNLVSYFQEWQVQTVYISSPLEDEPFLTALAQAGFNLIANREPLPGLEAHWVATVSSGDLVKEIGNLSSQLLDGQRGQNIELVPVIEAANPALFSPGRQNWVSNMIADLTAGYIDTGVENTNANNP
jgi:hypothetical protein